MAEKFTLYVEYNDEDELMVSVKDLITALNHNRKTRRLARYLQSEIGRCLLEENDK